MIKSSQHHVPNGSAEDPEDSCEDTDPANDADARRRLAILRFVMLITVVATVFIGWRAFWFLTDDAFIAFRYVSNSMFGHGLTWNAPPFRPVEGYTSFLWVILLKGAWAIGGVEPPDAANWMSLSLGYGTLFIVYRIIQRMGIPANYRRHRDLFACVIFVGVITNRTFLTWMSSGLETALFNFCVTWWIFCALTPREFHAPRWNFNFALSAALLTLTRPDGLLFYAATLLILSVSLWNQRSERKRTLLRVVSMIPLMIVPIHLLWRRATYEAWLPNTYYAKVVSPWPESGLRYLASFVLEYGLWIWAILFVLWVGSSIAKTTSGSLWQNFKIHFYAIVAVVTVLTHLSYYTLIVGGDHFEYRVYSHMIPLLFVSFVWMGTRVTTRPARLYLACALLILAAWPIPWVHWMKTRGLEDRESTFTLVQPIAAQFPRLIRPPVQWWDAQQEWLIKHSVCMRHQEHKVFWRHMTEILPSREAGLKIGTEKRNILKHFSVGVVGWVYPNVAILDEKGLNDYVIARNPMPYGDNRQMAHERIAPPGYIECFGVNFVAVPKVIDGVTKEFYIRLPRVRLRTDDEIRECESREWY